MTYLSAQDLWTLCRKHVALLPHGPDDVFVITTMAGMRVGLQSVTQAGSLS